MERLVYHQQDYAGFWRRTVADCIDLVFLTALVIVLGIAFLIAFGRVLDNVHFQVVWLLLFPAYMIGFKVFRGTTPGYWVLGLRIVAIDGADVTIKQLGLRLACAFFSGVVGRIRIVFDPHQQAWHDKIARTYVVRTNAQPVRLTESPQQSVPARPWESAPARPWATIGRFLRTNPLGVASGAIIVLMVLTAIFADVIAPYDAVRMDFRALLEPPSSAHWLGTDRYGRDVLSRIIYGTRPALLVGFAASFVGLTGGVILGRRLSASTGVGAILLRYSHTTAPTWVLRVIDGWMAFSIPSFLALLIALSIPLLLDRDLKVIILTSSLAIDLARIPRVAGIVLSHALDGQEYGQGDVARAIDSSLAVPSVIMLTTQVGLAILLEEMLSFLGGMPPPNAELGL